MPIYTYRREDGSRFDIKQRFHEQPLEFCPSSGQLVVRVVQPVGIVFKGSGFYVNDSRVVKSANGVTKEKPTGENGASKDESKESVGEAKTSDEKVKSEAKPAKQETSSAAS